MEDSVPSIPRPILKPMYFLTSLAYFGWPGFLFYAGFHWGMPGLIRWGVLPYYAYLTGLGLPLIILLLLSLVWMRSEGYPLTWAAMKERLRLKPMNGKAWLWTLIAILVVAGVANPLVSALNLTAWITAIIPVPGYLPAFVTPQPAEVLAGLLNDAFGGLKGNWLAVLVMLVVNTLGDELWCRGIILPRQELAFGRWTWLFHGVMWAFFHFFNWWEVLNLLPVTLALSFVCSRLKSTTPGIVIHLLVNGIGLLPIILLVVGVN
jgi:membrane protease YdiL (CAAX protease family)